jgi:sugar (pentulose or hexulose) kinase
VYLTFDVGTTSVKVVLYGIDGRPAHKVIRNYTLATPALNFYEADPELYWDAVRDGTREILQATRVKTSEIRSISGCSQGETVIFLDRDDRPVRPAIVWLDLRARDEAAELSRAIPDEELYRTTGLTAMDPTWSATKILWVKKHEPDLFNRTEKILLVEDYITYRLTGRFCSTPNLLSSTVFMNAHTRQYWGKPIAYLGVEKKLPEVVEPGSLVGTLRPDVARELGLDQRTLVVKGSMDQAASAIGAGNYLPGIVTETTGSVMAIGVTSPRVDVNAKVRLPFQPHVFPGSYLFLPYVQTAGSAYKWWRDKFCQEEVRSAKDLEAAYDGMNALAADVPQGCEGLVFLPFLAGAGQPENDPDARAVFYGLTLKHGKGHCTRAIQESIAFMLKKILADIDRSGVPMKELRAMGGGARSDLWLQIKADVTGLPIVRMEEEETSTLGAAILAAVRCGDYPDIAAAVRSMVRLGKRFETNPGSVEAYDRAYTLYNELYATLAPVFKRNAT